MKVKVYINRVQIDYQTEFVKATEYFKKHGVDFQFFFQESNLTNLKYLVRDFPQGKRILLMPVANNFPNDFDITMFVFNAAEFPPPNLPTGYCYYPLKPFIDISTHANNPLNYSFVEICHELMHALVFFANQSGLQVPDVMDTYRDNFNVDSPTGNFAEQWKFLEPYVKKGYQYFSPAEVAKWKLKPELWAILDKARGIASTPFIITSGYRTVQENINAGGKPNSAHLRGLAADLLCTDNAKRSAMIRGILNCGTPVFLELAQKHIHIDIDANIHSMGFTIVSSDD